MESPLYKRRPDRWQFRLREMLIAVAAAALLMPRVSDAPPGIAEGWSGAGWGTVQLRQSGSGIIQGTYTDTFGKSAGTIYLEWRPSEREFAGK